MTDSDIKLVLLIPLTLALVFMFWVLWRLEKQIRKERSRSEAIAPALADFHHRRPSNVRAERSSDTAFVPQPLRSAQSSRSPRSVGS